VPDVARVVHRERRQGLGPVRRHQRDAHHVAAVDVPHAAEQGAHDLVGVGGGEHRAVDLRRGGQGLKLTVQAGGHRVERVGQVLQLVAAPHRHPAGEVALRDAPGPLLEGLQRHQAAADLIVAHDEHEQTGQHDHEQEDPSEPHHRPQHVVPRLAQHHGPGRAGEHLVEIEHLGRGDVGIPGGGRPLVRRHHQVGLERRIGLRRAGREQHVARLVPDGDAGVGRGHAQVDGAPEKLGADLAHQRALRLLGAAAVPKQEDPAATLRGGLSEDQRNTQHEVGSVGVRNRGRLPHRPEDRRPPAVLRHELQGEKAPARQEIQAGAQHPSGVSRGGRAGAPQLRDRVRGNAPQGGVQQEQPLEHRVPQRLRRVVEARGALVCQVAGGVAVGDRGDQRDRHDGTADEQHQQTTTEPALQRPGLERHEFFRARVPGRPWRPPWRSPPGAGATTVPVSDCVARG